MRFVRTIEVKNKYGSWKILKEVEKKWGHRAFLCECSCGIQAVHPIGNLIYGKSKGCYDCSRKSLPNYHGKIRHYLHSIWSGIIQRTSNPKSTSYLNYGNRGIGVCERWRTFINFYEDIIATLGERPTDKHLLDRVNNDGNYEITNVRWATPHENSMNRRISGKKSMMIPIEELKRLGYFNANTKVIKE